MMFHNKPQPPYDEPPELDSRGHTIRVVMSDLGWPEKCSHKV